MLSDNNVTVYRTDKSGTIIATSNGNKVTFNQRIKRLMNQPFILIVDRIEGNIAVCEKEDRGFVNILLAELPSGIKEGDILKLKDGKYIIKDTSLKRCKVKERMNKLFE